MNLIKSTIFAMRARRIWNVAGIFILGALFLSVFSILQKFMLGADIFALRGYIIPVLYGGITGVILNEWYFRLKNYSRQIEQSEKQLRSLINNLPDFVIFKDGDGRWQDVNLVGQKLFQLESGQYKDSTDLQLAEQNSPLRDLFTWCHTTDLEAWNCGVTVRCETASLSLEGQDRTYDVLKIPLYRSNGSRQGMVIVGRDITEIRDNEKKLMMAYDSTLEGWAKAVEMRDKTTEDHTRRVVVLTEKLARIFRVDEKDIVHIRRGAMLHDIGKIGVPDSILNKPAALTDEEMNVMRQHPQRAYQMIEQIEFLSPALDIPYCHHERWDGTGYPRGLAGEEIPFAARIFSVVDVWDALTSDRPYRKAWTYADALAYIEEQAGKLFDAKVVEVFLANIDDILKFNGD
ncbi:MAG: HD domain-containing protein [Anaerolineales bacterium]|nr:HD domain-containing protein [Anaerolineales bacterium]